MSEKCPKISKKCPQNVQKMKKCPHNVHKMSEKCPQNVLGLTNENEEKDVIKLITIKFVLLHVRRLFQANHSGRGRRVAS
jgi:hypothetical protein